MIIIFLGDCTTDVANCAKQFDNNARMIDYSNYKDLDNGTYYVSLADLPGLKEFKTVLDQASTLYYSPPANGWSDSKKNFSYMKHWTEFYLMFYRNKKQVIGIDHLIPDSLNLMLNLTDNRKTESQQIWNAGCSITYGAGIESNQRYGQLVANYFNLPVSFLARFGSSVPWAADQIIRSDIKKNDIVIFGITSFYRWSYFDKALFHINSGTYRTRPEFEKVITPDFLECENSIYQSMISIERVINFCNKIGAKLLLVGILVDFSCLPYTLNLPNFLQLYGNFGVNINERFIDTGSDNEHPGPLTHQWYADVIINKLKDL